eukprot:m.168252 g.168252  ORF g.168252 m.168252 type:complete len:135 (-) comp14471_c0_seq21:894-1298(-)
MGSLLVCQFNKMVRCRCFVAVVTVAWLVQIGTATTASQAQGTVRVTETWQGLPTMHQNLLSEECNIPKLDNIQEFQHRLDNGQRDPVILVNVTTNKLFQAITARQAILDRSVFIRCDVHVCRARERTCTNKWCI